MNLRKICRSKLPFCDQWYPRLFVEMNGSRLAREYPLPWCILEAFVYTTPQSALKDELESTARSAKDILLSGASFNPLGAVDGKMTTCN